MINIANITRQMLWAFVAVMAATGEASAQAPLAVITQAGLPYFASPQAVDSKPLGQFAFNTHVCLTGKTYTWNRLQFFQYVLPSGEVVYTLVGKGIFARNPAGDKSCMSQVASTTLPASIPPPVQRAPQPTPNYVTPPTMAASGNVSAQTSSPVIVKGTAFAVIAKGSVPYYTSGNLGDVGTIPPQGQFAADQHLCANWKVTWHGREFVNVNLPSDLQVDRPDGGRADAIYSTETFIPDPAGDKKCESNAAQFATQPKSTGAGNGNFLIPDSVTDSALGGNIADMAEFIHSYPSDGPNGKNLDFYSAPNEKTYSILVNDPGAKKIMTKFAIAEGFYNRGKEIPSANDGWIYDDKKFNDLITARRWYQMALDQIKIEYPNIRNNALRFQSDPSGSIASMVNMVEQRIQFCPTALQRQQERAVVAKKKKDAAVLQEETAKEAAKAAKEERDAAAYQKAADPFDLAYVFRTFLTEDGLKRFSVIHALGLDGLSKEEYSENYYSFKRHLESMKVIVNDNNKQVDGSYIAIITYWIDDESHTSKVGYLKGADGLVITCYNTEDGSKNCR